MLGSIQRWKKGCQTLLIRYSSDEVNVQTKTPKQVEVMQMAILNDAAVSDSPKAQTIVGAWKSIKGQKRVQYKHNSATFLEGLEALQQPFSISTADFKPQGDVEDKQAIEAEMDEELQEIVQEMMASELNNRIQSKLHSGQELPSDKVVEGHVRFSDTSCFARCTKRDFCCKHNAEGRKKIISDLFKCIEYQVFPCIVADDPELRRCIGCGALNCEFFCPFCDLRRSVWKSEGIRAPPAELKDFSKLVEWGKKNAQLSKLIDIFDALKKKRSKLRKALGMKRGEKTEKHNMTDNNSKGKEKVTKETRKNSGTEENDIEGKKKRLKEVEEKVTQAKENVEKEFKNLTNCTTKVTLAAIKEYYQGCLEQRYPPIIEGVTLFNYAACALHAYLNITSATFRFTTTMLSTHHNLWSHYKREIVKLQLHHVVAFVQSKQNEKKQKKSMQRLNLIGRDCRKLEQESVRILEEMITKFGLGDERAHELLTLLKNIWKSWADVAPYLRMKKIDLEEVIHQGQAKAKIFIDIFASHASDDQLTYYMHLLDTHIWQWSMIYYKEFGCGYGILTTQAVEHRLKIFKRDLGHTFGKVNKRFRTALIHQSQRVYGRLFERKATKRVFKCCLW